MNARNAGIELGLRAAILSVLVLGAPSLSLADSVLQNSSQIPQVDQQTPQPSLSPAFAPQRCLEPGLAGQTSVAPVPSEAKRAGKATGKRRLLRGTAADEGNPAIDVVFYDSFPSVEPDTVSCTTAAAQRYAEIASRGDWPTLAKTLKPGAAPDDLDNLRRRLGIESDLAPISDAAKRRTAWDGALTAAIERYQERLGLRQTGWVDETTLKALNVSASERAKQLQASAERLAAARDLPFDGRHVVVNIPAAEVEAVEGDRVVHRYAAVVGGVDHQSPQISARITGIVVNPTWTLPASIIKNEVIPKMERNPRYLSRMGIDIFDRHGRKVNPRAIDWSSDEATEYTLRQKAGRKNSLGTLKIDMPNKQAVYMHDTPAMALFARDYRFLSHGCVRIEGIYDLATWLLDGIKGPGGKKWDIQAIKDAVKHKERRTIKLQQPMPVVWVYLDGWENSDRIVHFRDDIYNVDANSVSSVSQAK